MRASYTGRNRRISRKRAVNRSQYMNVFLLITIILLALWTIAGPYGFWKLHRMKEHRKAIYTMVIDASKENTRLKNQIRVFGTDRKFQEKMVRKRLGWVKKNELLYKFIHQGTSSR